MVMIRLLFLNVLAFHHVDADINQGVTHEELLSTQ